jgi:hypothetical protein
MIRAAGGAAAHVHGVDDILIEPEKQGCGSRSTRSAYNFDALGSDPDNL